MFKKIIPAAALIFLGLSLTTTTAAAKIMTEKITYKHGQTELTGILAYDDAQGTEKRPGVLVVHEWWGVGDYARQRAEQLAALGYVAFALDMYGTGISADNPTDATALSKPFYDDRTLMINRANAGLYVLSQSTYVDTDRMAVVGYCFGGTVALEMARAGADLKAVIALHAGLATPKPAQPKSVKAHILALNGADDPMVPQAERDAFVAEMTAAVANFRSIDYAGATHAFSNPRATEIGQKFNIPVSYNESADKQSWDEMENLLKLRFKK
jgi:dienelactone hydrolase